MTEGACVFPTSFAQQRLWFLDQLLPDRSLYNVMGSMPVASPPDVEALERSLNEIVRRHEALRTTFAAVDGQPVQVVAPTLTLDLTVVNLDNLPKTEHDDEFLRLTREAGERPFDLAHGPRATVLALAEEAVLLVTMHHIVSDGWSMDVFFREMATLYDAYSVGEPSPLPDLTFQYADFAVWKRQWLKSKEMKTQLAYWKRQLAGAPPVLELPTDRQRPPQKTFRGSSQSLVLSEHVTRGLKALSQQEGRTLFMTLLAAFDVLLHRYTGRDDIVVGSPIANRNRAEIEGLIGFFVNTMVLRTDLSGDPSFRDLLGRVYQVATGAYANQDLPFDKLVAELAPERDLSHTPMFQVMFDLQNLPSEARNDARTWLESEAPDPTPGQVEHGSSKFDLTLLMAETEVGLTASFEYSTDLFEHATVTRMLGHLQSLLGGIVADPDQSLSALPLLTDAERDQLLAEWNATETPYQADACVHELFEAQAALTPELVAAAHEDAELTYSALNRRSNQLAHHLRVLGVGPHSIVGICMDRSLDMLVGLLATLKAGGAYVPLDPAYPKARLRFMMTDARVSVLLTEERFLEELPEHRAHVVCLDSDRGTIDRESGENPVSRTSADSLAYLMYTSGSTGTPKGVAIPHRAINRLVVNTDYVSLEPTDRVAQVASYSFDASTFEIWGALLHGARVVVISKDATLDAQGFATQLRDQGITTLFLTTALFNQLAREVPSAFNTVRHLLVGGETVEPRWMKQVLDNGSPQRLLHVYGPTENTTFTTWHLVQEVADGAATVPIGRPVSNTQVYVLDGRQQPVPIGVSGELCIGGDGLAHGYLNRLDLTAKSFIQHPFRDEPDARLYRTGDQARYLPNGDIEFVGRNDHQIKIRGFRVELGEIKMALGRHPAVRETAVMARADRPGEKRLVAYVVPHPEAAASVSALRRFLQARLPAYMVPSAFVVLQELPLTRNGKVDRHALPIPGHGRPDLDGVYVAPRSQEEEALSKIWAEVLDVDRIGIHDNFFELGGDSILSIQIIARAHQAGLRFTPKQLFVHQTIADLAAVVDTSPPIQAEQGVVTGRVPLTPIQHWYLAQDLPDLHLFSQSILIDAPPGDAAALEQVVRQVLAHHDGLRLRLVNEAGDRQLVLTGPDEAAPFSRVDLSALSEPERYSAMQLAIDELEASLNVSEGPMLKVALFDLGNERASRLFIVIHHFVIDGVAWRILLEDVHLACEQLNEGEPIQLPPKTTSFKHWAERLTEHSQSPELQRELAYWTGQFRTPVAPLPLDYPDGERANSVASARTLSVSLGVEETTKLLQEVPRFYRTQINDVLLTALAQAFSRWAGAQSLLIDLEGHGREPIFEDVDLSRTIGWCTSLFPVLLDIRGTESPGEALKSVKETLRRIPNRGIGYGMLRYLGGARIEEKLRALPRAEVSLNYLGRFDEVGSESSWSDLDGETDEATLEAGRPTRVDRGIRSHLLEVTGGVFGARLVLHWTYSENLHRRSTIDAVARNFVDALRTLMAECQFLDAGGYTAGDFPLARLGQPELDRLMRIDREIEDVYPLSPMQQGMLIHTVYAPDSGEYVVPMRVPLLEDLDVPAFQRAWQRVVDRHQILRTSFLWEGLPEPIQVVHRQVTPTWEHHDWRELSPIGQEQRLESYLADERRRSFDFSRAPLMRLTLIQVREDSYELVWSCHHLLLDGWSLPLIVHEVFAFYEAFCESKDLQLPLPRPYRDYIAWLQEQDLSATEAFWRERLNGFTTPTPLGVGTAVTGNVPTLEEGYDEQYVRLTEASTAALASLARRNGLTLNTLVQGAWAILLSRYSGNEDVVFGATVSGRPAALDGVESMVGLFINTFRSGCACHRTPFSYPGSRSCRPSRLERVHSNTPHSPRCRNGVMYLGGYRSSRASSSSRTTRCMARRRSRRRVQTGTVRLPRNGPTIPSPWGSFRVHDWRCT